ncbi:MAG: DEAD/DEAH box helicase [Spirochaetaceae bacterium]|nr:DEAD/DEAH box helicase [Spirochaetaceae bacterium]
MQEISTKTPVGVKFTDLGLSKPLLKAVEGQGYETPTPIQAEAIPAVLAGRDVMAAAQTGTGKTAGFTLPLLHLLTEDRPLSRYSGHRPVRCLIVTPTRELAAQVEESVKTYGGHLPLRTAVVFGGVNIKPQINKLRHGVDILVATPGRLLDLYGQGAVRFDKLEVLVLDEADRMLDMGFIHDIKKILAILPRKRQNLMFSATFSEEIRELARGLVNDPIEISVSPRNTTVDTVSQLVYPVDKGRKTDLLTHLIIEEQWYQALVFTRTKHGANRLAQKLEKSGIGAVAIHGNKSQNARTRALADFKSGKTQILVATDIAARGLDINDLPHVVNFDLPNVPEDYVHRIGRTGRAGKEGQALSLVCAEESRMLRDIEKLIRKSVERRAVDGYEPLEKLNISHPGPKMGGGRPGGRPGGSGGGRRHGGTNNRRQGGGGYQGRSQGNRQSGNRQNRAR